MPQDESSPKIFISFRNGDEPYAAALLCRALTERFGRGVLFRSSESIRPGEPWAETIWRNHRESVAVIAVIGRRWLDIADERGERRLFQPEDWVRREVAQALEQGKTLIPVLVEGARRPTGQDLPPDLSGLTALQSVPLSHRQIEHTVDALVNALEPLLARPAREPQGPDIEPPTAEWLSVLKMPASSAYIVEREGSLRALRQAVAGASRQRMESVPILLHGGVGVGKSALAAEYFWRYAGEYQSAWWVDAQRPELIAAQLAAMAAAARFDVGRDVMAAVPAMFGQLRRRGRWLLVLDGLDEPGTLASLCAGLGTGGEVLITSRTADWGAAALARVPVGPLDRAQSMELLRLHLADAADEQLDRLAAALGDLPLALAQAGIFLSAGSLDITTYTQLLGTRAAELLERGKTYQYKDTLNAAWSFGLERLAKAHPAALELAELLSVLAPAPVPLTLPGGVDSAQGPLARAAADPIGRADLIAAIGRSGLIAVEDGSFRPTELFQSFVRGRLGPGREPALREFARRMLASVEPADPREPRSWDQYGTLLPHAVTVDLAASPDERCRRLLLLLVQHLVVRGDAVTARDLAHSAVRRWKADTASGDPLLLDAFAQLAKARYRLGDYAGAAALDQEVLARREDSCGPEHRDTLEAAHNLAIDTWACDGDSAAASALEDVVERRKHTLGPDDPDTLRSVHNLALARRAFGRFTGALRLDEGNWRRMIPVLGPDHPDTLNAANAVALDLRALGEWRSALALDKDTYTRRRAVLGADHADSLRSAYAVAVGLRRAGSPEALAFGKETHERCRQALGDGHPITLRSELLLAELLADGGETQAGALLRTKATRQLLDLAGWQEVEGPYRGTDDGNRTGREERFSPS